jgi:hypothetical protein
MIIITKETSDRRMADLSQTPKQQLHRGVCPIETDMPRVVARCDPLHLTTGRE